jgi:hypothetical protein
MTAFHIPTPTPLFSSLSVLVPSYTYSLIPLLYFPHSFYFPHYRGKIGGFLLYPLKIIFKSVLIRFDTLQKTDYILSPNYCKIHCL